MYANNLKVEKLDNFGRGISYYNNKIVFIENALIDEIVDVLFTKETNKYYEAKVVKYIKISDKRIKPICPYYDKCGGCSLMHLSYEEQLNFKLEKVNSLLKKNFNNCNIVEDIIFDNDLNYRNKVTLKVKDNKLGFYEKNTNNIVDINYCYLLDNRINFLIKQIKEKVALTNITDVMIRVTENDLIVVFYGKNIDEQELFKIKDMVSSIYIFDNSYRLIYGLSKNEIIDYLGNVKFHVSPDSFFQVNKKCCIKMYDKIKSLIKNCDKLLDLYCGVGSIGLYVSSKCKNLVGVEINNYAIEDANKNKELNNLSNVTFYNGKASDILARLDNNFDYIIVDPPRSGLDDKTIELIKNLKTKNLIYVSCDIMTLIRDIKKLQDSFNLTSLTSIDMFPNTYHVETVCLLSRR